MNMVEVTDTRVSCRRPVGLRIGMGVAGGVFGVLCLALLVWIWPAPATLAQRSPADILSRLAPTVGVPLVGLCFPTLYFLYLAGPEDLILDTVRRTYRFRRGFPLLASWKEGPLDHIAGLRVKTLSSKSSGSKSGSSSQVLLDWKNTQATPWSLGDGAVASRRPVALSTSRDAGRLRQEAQDLARRLGVAWEERVPAPERARKRAQSLLVLVPLLSFLLLNGLPPLLVARALDSQGQTTAGTVTSLRHGKGYSASYTYQVGDHTFDGRASLSASAYEALEFGGSITVSYLPAYPHTSTLAGAQTTRPAPLFLVYGALLVGLVLWTTLGRRDDR